MAGDHVESDVLVAGKGAMRGDADRGAADGSGRTSERDGGARGRDGRQGPETGRGARERPLPGDGPGEVAVPAGGEAAAILGAGVGGRGARAEGGVARRWWAV